MLTSTLKFSNQNRLRNRFISIVETQGTGYFGALGLGNLYDNNTFKQVDLGSLRPKSVSAGWGHSIVVTECGGLIVFGRPYDFHSLIRINKLGSVASAFARYAGNLTQILGGASHSGQYLSPQIVVGVENVEDCLASAGLSVGRTRDGSLFAFGLNRWGQCGVGALDVMHVYEPNFIQLPKVVSYDVGLQHCVCIGENGKLVTLRYM